jgi:hypothetical protein
MAVLPILVLLFGLVACGAVAARLARRALHQPAVAAGGIPRAVARRTTALRWAGVTIGVIVGVIAARSGDLGMGLLTAAPLFGLCVLMGVLIGELTVRPPHGPARTAAVEVRRIRDYLPRQLSRVVAGASGVLLVLLAATTSVGDPDDMGRPGRWLTGRCSPDTVESNGPWPGLFYTGRLAAVVLVGLLIAYLAVRRRSGSTSDLAVDDALRRRSARVVTGAVGVLVTIPLAGVCLTAAGVLLRPSCAPMWWKIMGWGLLALIPASLVMVSWCVAAILTPKDRADPLVRTR